MRVTPKLLRVTKSYWLLLLLLIGAVLSLARPAANSSPSSALRPVVIAHADLLPGEVIDLSDLEIVFRPLTEVPQNAFQHLAELQGKVSVGRLNAGYPLSPYVVAEEKLFYAPLPENLALGDSFHSETHRANS